MAFSDLKLPISHRYVTSMRDTGAILRGIWLAPSSQSAALEASTELDSYHDQDPAQGSTKAAPSQGPHALETAQPSGPHPYTSKRPVSASLGQRCRAVTGLKSIIHYPTGPELMDYRSVFTSPTPHTHPYLYTRRDPPTPPLEASRGMTIMLMCIEDDGLTSRSMTLNTSIHIHDRPCE